MYEQLRFHTKNCEDVRKTTIGNRGGKLSSGDFARVQQGVSKITWDSKVSHAISELDKEVIKENRSGERPLQDSRYICMFIWVVSTCIKTETGSIKMHFLPATVSNKAEAERLLRICLILGFLVEIVVYLQTEKPVLMNSFSSLLIRAGIKYYFPRA